MLIFYADDFTGGKTDAIPPSILAWCENIDGQLEEPLLLPFLVAFLDNNYGLTDSKAELSLHVLSRTWALQLEDLHIPPLKGYAAVPLALAWFWPKITDKVVLSSTKGKKA